VRWRSCCSAAPAFLAPALDPGVAGDRVARALGSRGKPLAADGTQLHTDAAAQSFARRAGVPAFTVGTHVCASPDAPPRVLAHELVHVRQAQRDPSLRATLEPARRQAAEREARAHERAGAGPEVREGGLVHYYGEAGHFYTVYLVALAAGFDDATAFRTAFYAQMPDEVRDLDATAMAFDAAQAVVLETVGQIAASSPEAELAGATPPDFGARAAVETRDIVQRGGHSLTGRPSAEEQARRAAVVAALEPGSAEFGLAVHAFGDSFAHSTLADDERMYQPVWGHAAQIDAMHAPDEISVRPALYLEYVNALYRAFAAAAASNPQHHDPARAVDENTLHALAEHVAGLPEEEQIAALRAAAQQLGRTMDPYAPETVELQTFAAFQSDPEAIGLSSPATLAAAAGVTLEQARAFMAGQAATLPPPLIPVIGPANPAGVLFDVGQVAVGHGVDMRDAFVRHAAGAGQAVLGQAVGFGHAVGAAPQAAVEGWNETNAELEAELRQFFDSPWSAGF
jgi:hypothetical protein